MGDSVAAPPDLWAAVNVYDTYIQSIKRFKSDYDALLSKKEEVEKAAGGFLWRHPSLAEQGNASRLTHRRAASQRPRGAQDRSR